uniref:Uncharacterized protein n=1 Tax=Solanum tuberosum TaxID=4113 RepID=M0ZSF5_SOLTU
MALTLFSREVLSSCLIDDRSAVTACKLLGAMCSFEVTNLGFITSQPLYFVSLVTS